jgi:competence protein ComEC
MGVSHPRSQVRAAGSNGKASSDRPQLPGTPLLLNSVTVLAVYDSGYPHTTQTYSDLLDAIEVSGAHYVETHTGQTIDLDSEVSMEFIYPDELGEGTNESSLSLRSEYERAPG